MRIADSVCWYIVRNVDYKIDRYIDGKSGSCYVQFEIEGDEEIRLYIEGEVYSENNSSVDKYFKYEVDMNIYDSVYWDFGIRVGTKVGRGFDARVDRDVGS